MKERIFVCPECHTKAKTIHQVDDYKLHPNMGIDKLEFTYHFPCGHTRSTHDGFDMLDIHRCVKIVNINEEGQYFFPFAPEWSRFIKIKGIPWVKDGSACWEEEAMLKDEYEIPLNQENEVLCQMVDWISMTAKEIW